MRAPTRSLPFRSSHIHLPSHTSLAHLSNQLPHPFANMTSAAIKKDDACLHAFVATMILPCLADKVQLRRDRPTQLELHFKHSTEEFEMTVKTSGRTQSAYFYPSDTMILYRHAIVPLLCAMLNADGFTATDGTTYTASSAPTTASGSVAAAPGTHADAPNHAASAAANPASNLQFPSVASLMAMRDACAKANEAHKKAEKEAFDCETLEYLQQRIIDQQGLLFIETDGKHGYIVRVLANIFIGGQKRTHANFRDIIPMLQAAVGPKENVTLVDGIDVYIQVMEV